MNVLSLFDGISCGRVALERAEIKVNNYFACEIDDHAKIISNNNYPEIIQLGDVLDLDVDSLPKIDLVIGGSPCQGFSRAGVGLNFDDPRSKLFFEFVNILNKLKEKNPDIKFLLENVSMKQEWRDIISDYLGVGYIAINSDLVSAQRRSRLYWTNIEDVELPTDKGILIKDILDYDRANWSYLRNDYFDGLNAGVHQNSDGSHVAFIPEATKKGFVVLKDGDCVDLSFPKSKTRRGRLMLEKSNCLTATPGSFCQFIDGWFRFITVLEMERLQTLPDNYTFGVSDSQRKKAIGNGWTVDVITHIFKKLKGDAM